MFAGIDMFCARLRLILAGAFRALEEYFLANSVRKQQQTL